ncbi:MAG: hypothetical protein V4813_16395 [Gemmatimonadota bacterium]
MFPHLRAAILDARSSASGMGSAPAPHVAVLLITLFVAAPLAAQSRPARPESASSRATDSLIAEIMADTLPEVTSVRRTAPTFRQSITMRPVSRRYRVGEIDAAEQGMYTSYVSRFRRATLRMDITPVSYRGDTSTTAARPQVSFGGATPISGRLDLVLRSADTLRVFTQSASMPGMLDAADVQALGAVGTSTIDLDAAALGVAARTGIRYAVSQPLGSGGVSLSFRGGVEYEPKPTGTSVVSWRGTTLRGGVGVSKATASTIIGSGVEVTQSVTDSLGGRNQFPGGGSLTVDARLLHFAGAEGRGLVALNGFFARPLAIQRPDVATRRIPIGDFMGATASFAIPVSAWSLLPTFSVLRESSSFTDTANGVRTTRDASGTTGSASLGLQVPIGRHLTITPEGGAAFGTLGQTTSTRSTFQNRRSAFSDPIRGNWFSLEISIRS